MGGDVGARGPADGAAAAGRLGRRPEAARGGGLRYGAGVCLALGLWLAWLAALDALVPPALGPGGLAVALLGVAGLAPALWLAVALAHGTDAARPARFTAIAGLARLRAGPVLWWVVPGLGLAALSAALALALVGPAARTGLAPAAWALWLPLIVPLVLAQVTAEEMLFRGYLMGGLRRAGAPAAVWAGVPAALFGLLHHDPGLGGTAAWLAVLATGLFGLAAALLAARAGSLAPAIGLHLGVNLAALLGAGVDGPLAGALPWAWPRAQALPLMACDLVAMAGLAALVLALPGLARPRA